MKILSPEQFANMYGEDALNNFGEPFQEQPSDISQAFQSGVQRMKTGFEQAREAENPLEAIRSGVTLGAGAIETAFSPLAPAVKPIMKPVQKGVDFVAGKISDVPQVQKFAQTKTGQKVATGAEVVGDLATIAGTAAAFSSPKPKLPIKSTEGLVGKVRATTQSQISNAPAKIMQRVARISKGKQAKFKQLSGESVGEYLSKRGIYGNGDDIATKLYDRFTKSKGAVDAQFEKMSGVFEPAPVRTALKELLARETQASTMGAPSPILGQLKTLMSKSGKGGWTMKEINTIKRLYERNVKVDYLKTQNPVGVARATNIDSAITKWQRSQASTLGFKNLQAMKKETQLAKRLLDDLGIEYSGRAGNNAITLTDWIMLSGGDPTAISAFLVKKTFSSKQVQSALAKYLNRGKTPFEVNPEITPTEVRALPPPSGGFRSQTGGGQPIQVAPKGANIEMTGKTGVTSTKPQLPQPPKR